MVIPVFVIKSDEFVIFFYAKVQKTNYKWEANKITYFWLGKTVNPLVLKGSKRDIFCTRSQTDFVLCFCRLLSNLLITSRNCDLTISSAKIRTFLAVIWNTWVYLYIWICWISITFQCRFFRISFLWNFKFYSESTIFSNLLLDYSWLTYIMIVDTEAKTFFPYKPVNFSFESSNL